MKIKKNLICELVQIVADSSIPLTAPVQPILPTFNKPNYDNFPARNPLYHYQLVSSIGPSQTDARTWQDVFVQRRYSPREGALLDKF